MQVRSEVHGEQRNKFLVLMGLAYRNTAKESGGEGQGFGRDTVADSKRRSGRVVPCCQTEPTQVKIPELCERAVRNLEVPSCKRVHC